MPKFQRAPVPKLHHTLAQTMFILDNRDSSLQILLFYKVPRYLRVLGSTSASLPPLHAQDSVAPPLAERFLVAGGRQREQ